MVMDWEQVKTNLISPKELYLEEEVICLVIKMKTVSFSDMLTLITDSNHSFVDSTSNYKEQVEKFGYIFNSPDLHPGFK